MLIWHDCRHTVEFVLNESEHVSCLGTPDGLNNLRFWLSYGLNKAKWMYNNFCIVILQLNVVLEISRFMPLEVFNLVYDRFDLFISDLGINIIKWNKNWHWHVKGILFTYVIISENYLLVFPWHFSSIHPSCRLFIVCCVYRFL